MDEIREVVVPALAESLSEGDIKWDKGLTFDLFIILSNIGVVLQLLAIR